MTNERREGLINTAHFKIIQERIRETARQDPTAVQITTRAKLRLIKDQLKEARVGRHTMFSDEAAERGGSGQHPAPLQYFVAAVGF